MIQLNLNDHMSKANENVLLEKKKSSNISLLEFLFFSSNLVYLNLFAFIFLFFFIFFSFLQSFLKSLAIVKKYSMFLLSLESHSFTIENCYLNLDVIASQQFILFQVFS